MNANEPYSIVNSARIAGNFGQTVLVTSFQIHAIGEGSYIVFTDRKTIDFKSDE